MDGIAIQSVNAPSLQHGAVGRAKGSSMRRALGDVTNVQKNVTFGGLKPSLSNGKPSAKKILKPGSKLLTPSVNRQKLATPSRKLTTTTPFKIHTDVKVAKKTRKEDKKDARFEKEYMPPCTDKDFEFPMPSYLQMCLQQTPRYTINLTPEWKEIDLDKHMQHLDDELLKAKFEPLNLPDEETNIDFNDDSLFEDDISLLNTIDSDESFSLEALDKELRAAGLDVTDSILMHIKPDGNQSVCSQSETN